MQVSLLVVALTYKQIGHISQALSSLHAMLTGTHAATLKVKGEG